MYLRSLTLKNVKRFRDLTLSFEKPDGRPRLWTVVIGENGTGKTTLLQAIALAASGRDMANSLLANPLRLRDVRRDESVVEIDSVFSHEGSLPEFTLMVDDFLAEFDQRVTSCIQLEPSESFFSGEMRQEDSSGEHIIRRSELRYPGWFVAGYGVRRFLPSPGQSIDEPTNMERKRLETLFETGELISTQFVERIAARGRKSFSRLLKSSLLRIRELVPELSDVELRGRGGVTTIKSLTEANRFTMKHGSSTVQLPANWLSQGYQGIIAWIADVLGHYALEAGELVEPKNIHGMVLIDEVDLFLHPRWQVTLVKSLKSLFPKVQFVVTTHSPLVLSGLEPDEIVRLQTDDEGNIVESKDKRHPALMTGSELYSAFFGVRELYPNELGKDLQRYMFLSSDPYRTDEEDAEMRKIEPTLRAHDLHPDWEPSPRRPLPDRQAARNGSS